VAQAYYGLLLARNMEQLAQGAVQSAESHLVLAERQVAAGALDARARLQAELAVSRARRDLATARQQIDQAQTAFAQATGLPEDSELSMPPTPSVSADLSGTLDRAMTERPDVRAADLQAEVAGFYRTAKLGDWAPSVDARFTYSWSENTGFQGRNDLWMFVVEANWLLWDGGLRIAQAREEASKARQAELAAKRARQSVEQEVRIAWQQHQRAGEALAATERERALAAENLRLAERALEAGAATWLEVQDARLGAIQAEMSHMQERTNRDLAALQLLLATGAL
jgi:outer membrane protein